MKAILICFVKGSGGNFLSRVLSLDTNVIPIGGMREGKIMSEIERLERYDYTKFSSLDFSSRNSNGLSNWVDRELNHFYFPLTMGVENLIKLNLDIVEPMHPEHFEQKLNYFGQDDNLIFGYIDPSDCLDWIIDQRYHKGVMLQQSPKLSILASTLDELEQLKSLQKNNNFIFSISLKNILESESKFLVFLNKILFFLKKK